LKEVWSQDKAAVEALHAIQRSLFSPLVDTIGFDYTVGEEYLTAMKRTLVIQACVDSKDKRVVEELIRRFQRYQTGQKDAFHPDLRSAVFKAVLLYSTNPAKDFDDILDIYKHGETVDERMVALSTIGAVNDLELVKKLLEMVLDSSIVKPQDVRTPLESLSLNPQRKKVLILLWDWLTVNWLGLHEKLGSGLNLLGSVVQACISLNVGDEFITNVQNWMEGKDCNPDEQIVRKKQVADAKRAFEQSLEKIKGATCWYGRDGKIVAKWLSKEIK
jgi:aminopeptidase 2